MSLRSKTFLALVAAALALPATSFAYWVPDNSEQGGSEVLNIATTKSRTQVIEELERAQADPSWAARQGEEIGSWPRTDPAPSMSRAAVRQALASMTAEEKATIQSIYTGP